MAEQAPHRHLVAVELRRRQLPARQVASDRRVELELPLLDQPHHPPGGHGLRDRRRLEDGLHADGAIALSVRKAKPARPEDCAIVNDRHGRARNLMLPQETGHRPVEKADEARGISIHGRSGAVRSTAGEEEGGQARRANRPMPRKHHRAAHATRRATAARCCYAVGLPLTRSKSVLAASRPRPPQQHQVHRRLAPM